MTNRPSLAHQRAVELLSDGEWHPFEDIFREVAYAIPPNLAFRQAEYQRAWAYKRNHPGEEVKPRKKFRAGKDDRLVRIGQRQLARKVLAQGRRFEHDKDKGLIRLRPEKEVGPEQRSLSAHKGWETRKAYPDYAQRIAERHRKAAETLKAHYSEEERYAIRSRATHLGRVRKAARALFEEFNR